MTGPGDVPEVALRGLDALKKHLEASAQVVDIRNNGSQGGTRPGQYPSTLPNRYFKVSPYDEQPHLLDLTSVSTPNQLLARALTEMQAVRDDYSTAPYQDSFNWSQVYERLQQLAAKEPNFKWEEQSFYIVVFRSQLSPETDRTHLGDLDKQSHREATAGGGLLKYWFGKPDQNGRNLATCLWRQQEDAKCGGTGPNHRQAARETRALYLEWHIERLRLTIGADASSWSIGQW